MRFQYISFLYIIFHAIIIFLTVDFQYIETFFYIDLVSCNLLDACNSSKMFFISFFFNYLGQNLPVKRLIIEVRENILVLFLILVGKLLVFSPLSKLAVHYLQMSLIRSNSLLSLVYVKFLNYESVLDFVKYFFALIKIVMGYYPLFSLKYMSFIH